MRTILRSAIPILSTARDAAAEICGEEVAEALVEANPRAIISNKPLPYFPGPVRGSIAKWHYGDWQSDLPATTTARVLQRGESLIG